MGLFRKIILFLFIILSILGDFGFVHAAFNEKINYQGKLTNISGVAVANGSYNVRFRLCTASDCAGGADPIWVETLCYSPDSGTTCDGTGTDQRVSVSNGLFSVLAGGVSSLSSVNFNQTLYLEVQVGGSGTTPAWETLTPRKVLGAVPAAFEAKKLGGATWAAPSAIGTGTPNTGAFTGLTSSGNIDLSSLSAGGLVKATVTTGRLSIATGGTDFENPLTFSNGLTRTTNAVKLGGTLTANTDVPLGGFNLGFSGTGNVGIGTAAPDSKLQVIAGDSANMTLALEENSATNNARLELRRSQGSFSSKAIVANNDLVGALRFSGYDGANYLVGSTIRGEVDGTPGTNDMPGRLVFLTTADGASAATERMRIDKDGNVGINDAAPTNKRLSILGSGAQTAAYYGAYLANTATSSTASINKYGAYISSTGTWNGASANNYGLYVDTPTGGTNNYAAVFAGGNVGIGTTAPTIKLHLYDATEHVGIDVQTARADGVSNIRLINDAQIWAINNRGDSGDKFIVRDATGTQYDPLVIEPDAGTNLLYLKSGGYVGMGTSNPQRQLHVVGGGGAVASFPTIGAADWMVLENNGNTNLSVVSSATGVGSVKFYKSGGAATSGMVAYDNTSDFLYFYTNGVNERMRIDSSGNVGIGDTAPTNKRLSVLGSGAQTAAYYGTYIANTATSSTASINKYGAYISSTGTWNGTSANNYGLYVDTPTGGTNNYAAVFAGGNVGIGTSAPGELLHARKDQNAGTNYKIENQTAGTIASANFVAYNNTGLLNQIGIYSSATNAYGPISASDAYLYSTAAGLNLMADNANGVIKFSSGGNSERLRIDNTGNVGINDTAPTNKRLSVSGSGAQTAAYYGAYLANTATSSTASINKYGAYISSTGTWNGTSANNYGLYVDTPTGGTNNYAAIFAGGNVGIGTTSPQQKLEILGTTDTRMLVRSSTEAIATTADLEFMTGSGAIAHTNATGLIRSYITQADPSALKGELRFFTNIGDALTQQMVISDSGLVGIGTSAPTNLLSLSGTTSRTIWMERNTTAATAGQGLTLSSGGAIAGTADLAGGDLTLKSGISTGTGSSAMHFYTATAGTTGAADRTPTEKMTILGSGYIGIGITNPAYSLDVQRDGDNSIIFSTAFSNTTVAGSFYGGSARGTQASPSASQSGDFLAIFGARGYGTTGFSTWSKAFVGMYAAENWTDSAQGTYMTFATTAAGGTSRTEKMRITDAGYVGIGLTPTYQLQLSTDSAGKPNGGSWANSSDMRLKTNIEPIVGELALNKILQLQGVRFDWINPEDHGNMTGAQGGFIAQEVEKVFPKWISEIDPSGKDVALVGEGEKIKSLSLPFEYDAYMVEAIKEQQKQIEELKLAINLDGNIIASNGDQIIVSLGQSQSFKDLVASAVKDALKSLTGTVIAAGEWTFEKLTAKQICVEDVCVDKSQLQELLEKNQIQNSYQAAPSPVPESVQSAPDSLLMPVPIIVDENITTSSASEIFQP